MAELSKDTDQSMEDILQSIKRIIADEGEPAPAMQGSEVLELTELLEEDAAPPVTAEAPVVAEASVEIPPANGSQEALDALFDTPAAVAEEPPVVAAPAPQPEPEIVVVAAAPEPVTAPEPQHAPAAAAQHTAVEDSPLLSQEALAASIAALSAIPHPTTAAPMVHGSPGFRSGTTVEDLVMEALRPMLKDWLDTNLPGMVRSLVEREIRRLSAQ